jgi:hypothetical protein
MIKPGDHGTWGVVRERRAAHGWTIATHRIGRKPESVLVAKCTDGRWATNALRHERPRGAVPLTAGMAKEIDRLYEVDTSLRVIVFAVSLVIEEPSNVLKADVQVCWQITDPVRAVSDQVESPVDIVRPAAERELLALFERSEMTEPVQFEKLVADSMQDMRAIAGTGLKWGRVLVRVRPTEANIQAVRTSRVIDREKRAIVKDRIEFYSDVINTAPIGLLAMWLSEDPSAAKDVLTYISDHDIRVGDRVDADDPVRSALNTLLADDFQRNEMLHAWFDGLNRRNQDDALNLLRDALATSVRPNGGDAS